MLYRKPKVTRITVRNLYHNKQRTTEAYVLRNGREATLSLGQVTILREFLCDKPGCPCKCGVLGEQGRNAVVGNGGRTFEVIDDGQFAVTLRLVKEARKAHAA